MGAHTQGFNSVGYGIDFIGDFTDHNPSEAALAAYEDLTLVMREKTRNLSCSFSNKVFFFVQCLDGLGKIAGDFVVKGHRQTKPTECPGNHFYETLLPSFPHWV